MFDFYGQRLLPGIMEAKHVLCYLDNDLSKQLIKPVTVFPHHAGKAFTIYNDNCKSCSI